MTFPIEISKTTFVIGIIGGILLLYVAYTQGFFSGLKTTVPASTQTVTK